MVSGLTLKSPLEDRLLDQVLGHQEIIKGFLTAYHQGQLPHAFLFVGPSGVGKKTVALALAQGILCERGLQLEAEGLRPCGVCGSCRRVLAPPTESLLIIEPEKHLIKMEQARQVLDFFNLRSLGKNRVVIIDGAEALNPQAGNSLLKVLEEPPSGTFFFLIANSPSQVLRTLRSRSQVVSFSPLPISDLRKKSKAPEWALRAAQGSFERLEKLTQKEELQVRDRAVAWLADWLKNPQGYLKSEHRDLVRDRSSARSLSQHLCWFLRDAAYLKSGVADSILNVDKETLLNSLSQSLTLNQLYEACEKALKIQSQLSSNFDPSLVFEQFWIETRPTVSALVGGNPP